MYYWHLSSRSFSQILLFVILSRYPSQTSKMIFLNANQSYFIEGLMLELYFSDHFNIGVMLPNNTLDRPISSKLLSPIKIGKLIFVSLLNELSFKRVIIINHERDLVSFSFLVRNGTSREKREIENSREK